MAGLTDEEMAAIEAPQKGLTDEEMAAHEASQPNPAAKGWEALKKLPGKIMDAGMAINQTPERVMANGLGRELDPDQPTGAALRGFGHGASFGFTDKLRGVSGAFDEATARASPFESRNLDQQYPNDSLTDALTKRYGLERDASYKEQDTADREQPIISAGAKASGAIASSAANPFRTLGAAGMLGRIASTAGQSELYGLGSSRADDVTGKLKDAAESGGIGLLGAAAAEVPGAMARGLGTLQANGARGVESNIVKAAAKDLASERGRLGGISSGSIGDLEKARAAANNPNLEESERQWFKDWLESPAAMNTERRAAENLRSRLPSRFDEMGEARGAMEVAGQATEPAAIQDATSKRLGESVLVNHVLPRAERYAQRIVPGAIGSVVGGPIGAGAGALGGAAMGAPGTSLGNLFKTPEFQHRVGQVGSAIMSPIATASQLAAESAPAILDDKSDDESKVKPAINDRLRANFSK